MGTLSDPCLSCLGACTLGLVPFFKNSGPAERIGADSMADAIGDERIRFCYSRRIDYVFVGTPGLDGAGHVESCEVVGDDRFGTWPSDHLGVFVKLRAPPVSTSTAPKL